MKSARFLTAVLLSLWVLSLLMVSPVLGAPKSKSESTTKSKEAPKDSKKEAKRKAAAQMLKMRKMMALNAKSIEHFKSGQFGRSKATLEEMLKIDPNNGVAHYNLACVYCQLKKPTKAIGELNLAVDNGYLAFNFMTQDPDLDSLRKLPGYKKLLARREQVQRERASKILASLKKRFGKDFICEVDHDRKLVFATDIDARTLKELKVSLSKYARGQWKALFDNRFDEYVTVLIPRNVSNLPRNVGGAYNPYSRELITRSIGMILTHEFTHALHFADQGARGQEHRIWVIEGLATLFETSTMVGDVVKPLPNRRGNMIKRLVRRKMNIPWSEFFELSHANFMKKSMVAYPQGRYIFMYLHSKGLLKKWYDAYTSGYESDKSGAKALEKVTGKSLKEVETDWLAWVATLKDVPVLLGAEQACIGVQLARQVDGVRIVRVIPDSAAANAGLRRGDVIVKLDGRRMVDTEELLRTVTAHEVGDEVEIEYKRGDEYKTVTTKLRAAPKRGFPIRRKRKPQPKPKTKPSTQPAKKKAA